MKEYNKPIGNFGEDLCTRYLIKNNYFLKDRNYKKKNGEIDIIATKNNILVFVEVKTRFSENFSSTLECINYKKQLTIKKIASYYIYINNLYNYYIRYDACFIIFNKFDNTYKFNYIEDAFR